MAFDPRGLTAEQRRSASRAVVEASNRVFRLDRSALGAENSLALAYAYGEVEELLHLFAAEIVESAR